MILKHLKTLRMPYAKQYRKMIITIHLQREDWTFREAIVRKEKKVNNVDITADRRSDN